MKRLLILLIFYCCFLVGCGGKPQMINNVDEFEALFNEAIKYDIRSDELCEEGHIKDFLCVGSKDSDTIAKNIDIIAKNKRVNIVLIGDEEKVIYILNNLSRKGYKNLYYFEGGYIGYVQAKGDSFVPETGCGC